MQRSCTLFSRQHQCPCNKINGLTMWYLRDNGLRQYWIFVLGYSLSTSEPFDILRGRFCSFICLDRIDRFLQMTTWVIGNVQLQGCSVTKLILSCLAWILVRRYTFIWHPPVYIHLQKCNRYYVSRDHQAQCTLNIRFIKWREIIEPIKWVCLLQDQKKPHNKWFFLLSQDGSRQMLS